MKTIFIEARSAADADADIPEHYLDELPNKICLIAAVQFICQIEKIKKKLEEKNKEVFVGKGPKCRYRGQVLGCDVSAAEHMKEMADAFLYIGSGEFHPVMIAFKTDKPVFRFNPLTNEFSKLNKKETESMAKKIKAMKTKFYSSKTIGVLVSTKHGQQNPEAVSKLKQQFKDKNLHLFAFDTLDFGQLMNFPEIEFWINTACPRIADDAFEQSVNMLNWGDL